MHKPGSLKKLTTTYIYIDLFAGSHLLTAQKQGQLEKLARECYVTEIAQPFVYDALLEVVGGLRAVRNRRNISATSPYRPIYILVCGMHTPVAITLVSPGVSKLVHATEVATLKLVNVDRT